MQHVTFPSKKTTLVTPKLQYSLLKLRRGGLNKPKRQAWEMYISGHELSAFVPVIHSPMIIYFLFGGSKDYHCYI